MLTKNLSDAICEYKMGTQEDNPDIKRIYTKINHALLNIWTYFKWDAQDGYRPIKVTNIYNDVRTLLSSFEKIHWFWEAEQKNIDQSVVNLATAIRKDDPGTFIQEILKLFGIKVSWWRFLAWHITLHPLHWAILSTKYKTDRIIKAKQPLLDIDTLLANVPPYTGGTKKSRKKWGTSREAETKMLTHSN